MDQHSELIIGSFCTTGKSRALFTTLQCKVDETCGDIVASFPQLPKLENPTKNKNTKTKMRKQESRVFSVWSVQLGLISREWKRLYSSSDFIVCVLKNRWFIILVFFLLLFHPIRLRLNWISDLPLSLFQIRSQIRF